MTSSHLVVNANNGIIHTILDKILKRLESLIRSTNLTHPNLSTSLEIFAIHRLHIGINNCMYCELRPLYFKKCIKCMRGYFKIRDKNKDQKAYMNKNIVRNKTSAKFFFSQATTPLNSFHPLALYRTRPDEFGFLSHWLICT